MRKPQTDWWQPEGWMRFGSIVAVLLLVGFLIFLVVGFFLPRLRKISNLYNSASALICAPCAAAPGPEADLVASAAKGDLERVKAILTRVPDIVDSQDAAGATALHQAAAGGHQAVVEYLLAKNADPNAKKKDGVTPLHVAASLGRSEIARMLVEAGADGKLADKKGRTPLSIAREKGRADIVQLLEGGTKPAGDPEAPAPDEPAVPGTAATPALLVLDTQRRDGAINLSGDARLTVRKGGLVVNSAQPFAIFNSFSVVDVRDGGIRIAGGARNLGERASMKPEPQLSAAPVPDPLAGLKIPWEQPTVATRMAFLSGNTPVTLRPGTYERGITTITRGLRITMLPGVYVIKSGQFSVIGAQLVGEGVTILLPPNTTFFAGSGAQISLSPPTKGPLKGIVIASVGDSQCVDLNSARAELRGTVYAPKATVSTQFRADAKMDRLICGRLAVGINAALEVTGE